MPTATHVLVPLGNSSIPAIDCAGGVAGGESAGPHIAYQATHIYYYFHAIDCGGVAGEGAHLAHQATHWY